MTARQRAWLLPPAAFFLAAGILLGRGMASPLLPWLACIPALAAVILLRERFRFAACMVLCLVLGSAAGQMAWHPALPPEGDYEVRGIVSDEIRRGRYGQVRTVLTGVALNGRPLSSGAYWTFYTDEDTLPEGLYPGKEVSFRASLYYPSGASNPDGYDFREELLRRGVTVCVYGDEALTVSAPSEFSFAGAAASLRARLAALLVERMGEESGSYTAALLLGSRSLVPSEDRAAFARLGIAHLLAVSGFHTGILVLLLSALLRLLHLPPSARLAICGIVLLCYSALCGMSPPVLRASLLLVLVRGSKLLNRPAVGLHLLCAVMILMLLWSPVQLTGVSFQLTFGAMLGLTLITPYLDRLDPFRSKLLRKLWSSFAVVIGAELGVLLPVLSCYQKLPLLALLVNLPASLYASVLIAVDWLVLVLLPLPFLCAVPAAAAGFMTALLLRFVRSSSSLPGITLWTHAPTLLTVAGVLAFCGALCILFRPSRRTRLLCLAAGAAITCFSLLPVPHRGTEYIQFSVGNADAAVLWDEDTVWVMDTGTDDGVLTGFLRRNRLTPDAVILTHLHSDHAGGLQSLLDDEIPVRLLYLPEGAREQQVDESILLLIDAFRDAGTEIRELSRGDILSLPSGTMEVLWPESGRVRRAQDANNYSLAVRLALRGVTMLQTGDLSGLYETYAAVPADLLKAAHHGSASSTSDAFLSAVDPQAVLLSCRHLSRHEAFAGRIGNTPVWSTAVSGALTVRFREGAFEIIPFLSSLNPEVADHGP